tara:strand:+ start:492 stop:1001 length:510 start_codon:yes stop_codon:yes gene_type:complete
MGVSGCGKTVVGKALAERIGYAFLEGDEYHPSANISKMSSGIPLNDDDRVEWMQRIRNAIKGEREIIISCSALRMAHRDFLRDCGRFVLFLHLEGERALIEKRIGRREGHFFDPNLLASQIEALENPAQEENVITLKINDTVENIVASALVDLREKGLLPPKSPNRSTP